MPIHLICEHCRGEFTRKPSHPGRFCSYRCRYAHAPLEPFKTRNRAVMPLAGRFWQKVLESEGCWIWAGSKYRNGYGRVGAGRKGQGHLLAHRVSWTLHFGPIPSGLCVCHHCDNPPCVRPDHLFLGSVRDNAADRDAKGRWHTTVGEARTTAKLSDDRVRELRRRRDDGQTMQNLATEFGVSYSTVNAIVHRRKWAHVT